MKNNLYTFISILCACLLLSISTTMAQDMGTLCNGNIDVSVFGATGNLYDSGGAAGQYDNAGFYRYTICNTAGCPMDLNIAYDLETGYDYLEIFDGQNIYDSTLGTNPLTSNIYTGRVVALSLTGLGSTTFTSAEDCVTAIFSSDSSVPDNGFDIAWTSTCGTTTTAHTGDGVLAPGPNGGSASSPSNDFCSSPAILDSSLGIDEAAGAAPATYTNINSTSGSGIGLNGCDPNPSEVTSQSTLETTVYFQYCTGVEPGNFVDLGADDGAGGGPCVNYSLYQHLNDGDGSACFDANFTEVQEGTGSLVAGQPLPPNTCWTFIIDGLVGAECDFRVWFREDIPGCNSVVDFTVPAAVCSGTTLNWTPGGTCSIPGVGGSDEVVDLFAYAPGGIPGLAPFGYENIIDVSSPTESAGFASNDPQGIEDKDPNLLLMSFDNNCTTKLPIAAPVINNTCSPFTVTYFLVVFDYNWDTDGDGLLEYDPECLIRRYDVQINPAQPTATTVAGSCTNGAIAYLQVGSNTCDTEFGLPAPTMPCGTGVNTNPLNYSWTAMELALLLTGDAANAACYSDLTGTVNASCAQTACPVICTPPTPTLIVCP